MEIYDEDSNKSDPDWCKMSSRALNQGYKEGISSVEDSVYQEGFVSGYEGGFESGFQFGIIHGIQRANNTLQQQRGNDIKNTALKENCQICVNSDLADSGSINVKDIQMKANQQIKEQYLNTHFATIQQLGLIEKFSS